MNDTGKREKSKIITLIIDEELQAETDKVAKSEKWSKAATYRKLLDLGIAEYHRIQEIIKNAK